LASLNLFLQKLLGLGVLNEDKWCLILLQTKVLQFEQKKLLASGKKNILDNNLKRRENKKPTWNAPWLASRSPIRNLTSLSLNSSAAP
jgi:hypothetical protein